MQWGGMLAYFTCFQVAGVKTALPGSAFACCVQAREAIRSYKEQGLPLSRCTVASDGFGSWPVYDQQGTLLSYEVRTLN